MTYRFKLETMDPTIHMICENERRRFCFRKHTRSTLRTLYHLSKNEFLCGDHLTLADIAAYAEIGQVKPAFTNVFDLTPFPRVCSWLKRMEAVDGHDVVHTPLSELGDISKEAPTMEAIKNANVMALKAIKASQSN